jgi:hypothetical protein
MLKQSRLYVGDCLTVSHIFRILINKNNQKHE